jgi:glyoxylase-like metal-dependent hydrolase (beta-lactamase superfamily II)
MVDGGVPNKLRAFKRKLSKLHIHPEEIKLIVLTHSHFDHSGSAKNIRDLTGAKIIFPGHGKSFSVDKIKKFLNRHPSESGIC